MGVADTFPVDADFAIARSRAGGEIVHVAASGEEHRRISAPNARLFSLQFNGRPVTDWQLIEQFRLRMHNDFFDLNDITEGRHYSCFFAGEPQYDEVGNNQINIRVTLREAVGKPLSFYPTTPLLTLGQAAVDVGDGLLYNYSGYGFKITGTLITSVELDGVSLGLTTQKFDAPLLFHALKVLPNTASVSKVEIVH